MCAWVSSNVLEIPDSLNILAEYQNHLKPTKNGHSKINPYGPNISKIFHMEYYNIT